PSVRKKLSLFSGVPEEAIALLPNAPSIYEVPLTLEDTGIADFIADYLALDVKKPDLKDWREVVTRATAKHDKTVKVAFMAKYVDNTDTYMSVFEAVRSAAWHNNVNVHIEWIDAADHDEHGNDLAEQLKDYDGILVPGGFGQ